MVPAANAVHGGYLTVAKGHIDWMANGEWNSTLSAPTRSPCEAGGRWAAVSLAHEVGLA